MARLFVRNEAFVKAAAPVIIKPLDQSKFLNDYGMFELSSSRPQGLFNIARQVLPNISLTEFHALSFGYVTGVWSGPDIETMAQDPNVHTIWPDGFKSILQYFPVGVPYPVADPNHIYSADTRIKNPLTKQSKVLNFTSMEMVRQLVGADVANAKGFTGRGVTVQVNDTGGHKNNPATPQLERQTTIKGIYMDENSHGEWTASAIAGRKVEDRTFTMLNPGKAPVVNQGIAPDVRIIEVKALGFVVGTGTDSMLLKSLDDVMTNKADVTSNSWGGKETLTNETDSPYYDIIQKFKQNNIIPVFASGDSGPSPKTCDTPGDLTDVLTVGSYNAVSNAGSSFGDAGQVSGFSGRGPTVFGTFKPDTIAPGSNIDSAIGPVLDLAYEHIPHDANAISGTSMSCPIVAGLVALMRQAHAQLLGMVLTLDEIKTMLRELGHPKNNNDGWGMISWQMYEYWLSTQYGFSF